MSNLSAAQLKALTLEEISYADSPLLVGPLELLKSMPGDSYEQQELELLKHVPARLANYYLVVRLEAQWANGGLQAVALDKDIDVNASLLEKTTKAFEFFGAERAAQLMLDIVPLATESARQIDALVDRGASDEELAPIWEQLDALTDRYEDISSAYQNILRDIHSHSDEWQACLQRDA